MLGSLRGDSAVVLYDNIIVWDTREKKDEEEDEGAVEVWMSYFFFL